MSMQMTAGDGPYQQHSEDMDCRTAYNRCPLASSDGGLADELGQRPYRCHVCRVGFKLKVIVTHTLFCHQDFEKTKLKVTRYCNSNYNNRTVIGIVNILQNNIVINWHKILFK